MSRRPFLAVSSALALSLAAAACGSSSTTTSPSPAQASTAPSTAPAPPTTAGVTAPVTGTVPAVTGATDLTKEPMVAAGTGAPPTALTGQDLVAGTGTAATATSSQVTVQYVGAFFTDGKVFDASWTRNAPATFPLNGVVPGFRDAIIGMKIGGRREVVIPPALGYGADGQPPTIPGNSTLVFVIDLLAVQG